MENDLSKELAIRNLLLLVREHKQNCSGNCNISLFPLRYLFTKDEWDKLSAFHHLFI